MSMVETVAALARELSEMKRVMANIVQTGTVAAVDSAAGTVRLSYGTDENGKPRLGPPIPWMEQGGVLKTWTPPTVGQVMMALNPVGDDQQGMALNGAFSSANAAPSNKSDENVIQFGPWTIGLAKGKMTIQGPVIEVSGNVRIAGNVDFTDGYVRSGGKAIDASHRHNGVRSGGDTSGTPL